MVKFKGKKGSNGAADASAQHVPVMLNEVLYAMSPRSGAIYVDGTFGLGGYTRGLLESADCRVIAFDQDPAAQPAADQFKQEFGDRFEFVLAPFEQLTEKLAELSITSIDGLVLDLGVSSPQLDQAERGFSFRLDGPLDMRMSQKGLSAADVVNDMDEEELANIIWQFGEEKKSRVIARKIVHRRDEKPFKTTTDLADLIAGLFPVKGVGKIHPATRTFQALRIYVNQELSQLKNILDQSMSVLADLGRLVVVSFHSLEDRLVKQFFRGTQEFDSQQSRYMPETCQKGRSTYFELLRKGAIKATEEEIFGNPRARSARLRWGIMHKT